MNVSCNEDFSKFSGVLNLDRTTGTLTWKIKRGGRGKIGSIAGGNDAHGYICIKVFGKTLKAHRIVWLLCTGNWPKGDIDHINHFRTDNRFENLRDVSRKCNLRNMKPHSTNTSGVMGVSKNKNGKFRAYIREGGMIVNLGTFTTLIAAKDARQDAEQCFGYHENHGKV